MKAAELAEQSTQFARKVQRQKKEKVGEKRQTGRSERTFDTSDPFPTRVRKSINGGGLYEG